MNVLYRQKLERVIDHRRPPPPATHATNVKNHSGASADAAANNSDEEVYEQLTGDALKSRSVTASSFFADLSVAAEVSIVLLTFRMSSPHFHVHNTACSSYRVPPR